ncbi:hypothetical protein PHYSODRAFT_534298, partial [Phytophthora sojae]
LPLAQARRNSRSLYRRILRESRQLEPNTRELYRRFARSVQVTNESFRSGCRLHETPDGYIQDVSIHGAELWHERLLYACSSPLHDAVHLCGHLYSSGS